MQILSSVLEKYDVPVYIYDCDKIRAQYELLSSSLLDYAQIYYSMKANPNKAICQFLLEQGSQIEVSSAGEYAQAVNSNATAEQIIFTSPGKTRQELEKVIVSGIGIINVESFEEAEIINEIAKNNDKIVDIALRINTSDKISNAKIKMTGVSSQFGIEEKCIDDAFISKFKSLKATRICGIQVYMGTNILEANDIVKNTEYILGLAKDLQEKFAIEFSYINFGGGFGVPYFEQDKELDMDCLRKGMKELSDENRDFLKNKKLVFESGRFLMAESGKFYTKVLYVKESKGKKYLVCNGGSNFHASSAFLGRFVRNNYKMHVLNNASEDITKANVVGPLCTPTDILGKDVLLPGNVEVGDYIVIDYSGAYGLTYSPCLFLMHDMPAELLYKDGSFTDISIRRNIYE